LRSAHCLGLALVVASATATPRGPEGAVLGSAGIRHEGHVASLAFDPTGRLLATCGGSTQVKLWSLPGGEPAGTLEVGSEWVLDLSWSPGGDALAVGGSDATVTVWEVATGQRLYRSRQHQGEVQRVAFLPDGRVASGGRTGLVLLHDLAGGTTTSLLAPEFSAEETGEGPDFSKTVTDLVPDQDGSYLLVGTAMGQLHLWDLDQEKRVKRIEGIAPRFVVARPGADQVAVLRILSGPDEVGHAGLELLEVPSLQTHRKVSLDAAAGVTSLAFTAEGATVLVGSHGLLQEVPLAGGPGRRVAHPGFPTSRLAVSQDGTWLGLAAGPDVRLVDRRSRTVRVASDGHREAVAALVEDAGGTLHSIGAWSEYKVWDLRGGQLLASHEVLSPYMFPEAAHINDQPPAMARAAPLEGRSFLLFAGTGTLERRTPDAIFGTASWSVYRGTCVASAEADLGLVGDEEGRVHLLRPSRPRAGTRRMKGAHDARVTALAVSPDGAVGLSGGQDTRVRRLDVRGRRSAALPAAHVGPILDVEVSRDGRLGASGSMDRTVALWDLARGQVLATLGADSLDLTGYVAITPAGDVLAASTMEGTVRIFEVATGRPLVELPVGTQGVGPVHFARSTGELLAATADGTIRRWPRSQWSRPPAASDPKGLR
jgi:WD40 repeat protein